MTIHILGRLAGVAAITLSLAGCIDMTMDVQVQSETNAKATVTSTMGKDIYPMVKASTDSKDKSSSASSEEKGFCEEENSTLTENADGSATCVQVSEGPFADLKLNDDGKGATFTVVSPGQVRVAFDTSEIKGDLASSTGGDAKEEMDEETKAMMAAFFEGHSLTLRIGGKEVTETNMDIASDKTSAEKVIPFLDLINGTVDLPDELYAVVRVN